MKKGIFLLLISTIVFADNYKIHILKQGETLSEILQENGYTPLYGEDKWVEKTLKINHLSSLQDKDIKKGFPIILPSKAKSAVRDTIIYKNMTPPNKRYGLLSALISDHQDVNFVFDYSRRSMNLRSTQIELNDNFSLALEIDGHNNYKYNDLYYNFNGRLNVISHGVGRFDNNQTRTMNLQPTIEVESDMEVSHKNIPFNFGPSIMISERSIAFEEDSAYKTRRDQSLWLGMNISKKYTFTKNIIHTDLAYKRIFGQNSLETNANYSASSIMASAKLNITESYLAGIQVSSTQYRDTDLVSEDLVGINFSYMIK